MNKNRVIGLLLAFWASLIACQAQTDRLWELQGTTDESEIKSFENTGVILAKNGVIMTNSTTVLTADQAMANQVTGEVTAEGDVTVMGKDRIWRGTNVVYNFKSGEIRSGSFRTTRAPFFIGGQNLAGSTNKLYSATNAIITSDDVIDPLYHIRAKSITINPGQYFEARSATVYVGNIPIFYFPYYRRYLGRHPNNFEFTPGYRSMFGPYLLSTYNWTANSNLDGAIHMDYRDRRGFAGGPDFHYGFGALVDADTSFYYARDWNPTVDGVFPGGVTNVSTTAGVTTTNGNSVFPHRDRYRFNFIDKSEITSNLTAKIVARYQSDPLVIHDFFEREYRQNVQPSSFAEATQTWPNFTLDAMGQVRLNEFYDTVERLPDIKLTGQRQQVFATPIFYESESSVGYFRRRFVGDASQITPGLAVNGTFSPGENYEATRADTYHQFTLPKTYFGWLNVTPRVGGRITYYSDTHGNGVTNMNEQLRGVFNTGTEVSFKATRTWQNTESKFWDVNGLRHIIEPDFNYVFVPGPTVRPNQLPQFDYETSNFRLQPIDFPDYNSIDSIDSENVIRLALRNKLQTKRADTLQNLVDWAVYTDWRLDSSTNRAFPLTTPPPPGVRRYQSRFSDVFSDLDFRPRSWLTFNSQVRYSTSLHQFVDAYHSIVVQPNDTWSASVSYRYLMNNDPEFFNTLLQTNIGDKLLTVSLYYKMNENWGAHVMERFDANQGRLDEQVYSLYRDLRSWTAALNFRVRKNSTGPTDFGIFLTYSLKAFPHFKVGGDSDHAPSLLGNY